jgi:hypothetical protein
VESCGQALTSSSSPEMDVMFTWDGATATAAALRSRSGKSRRPHQSNDSELSKVEDMRMTHLFDGGTAFLDLLDPVFTPLFLPGQLALLDVRYYTVQHCIVQYSTAQYCLVLWPQLTHWRLTGLSVCLHCIHGTARFYVTELQPVVRPYYLSMRNLL